MGATACIVFGLLAIAFRSVVVAIRAVLSIAVIVACTFGCAAAVFNEGILDSPSETVLSSQYGGIFWLMPLLAFSIIVGASKARQRKRSDACCLNVPGLSPAQVLVDVARRSHPRRAGPRL